MSEIVELRTARTKTFHLGGEEYRMERYLDDQHYHEDGEWLDLAPEWVQRADGSFDLLHAVTLGSVPPASVGYTLTRRDTGSIISATLVEAGGEKVEDLPLRVRPTIEDHRLRWDGMLPMLDIYLVPHARGMTAHHILYSDAAPRSFLWRIDGDGGTVSLKGRENINRLTPRDGATDECRYLEVEAFGGDGERGVRWSGRAKAIDPVTRVRAWTTEIAYPVRLI